MFCPKFGSQLPDNSKFWHSYRKNVAGLQSGFLFQNKMRNISRNTSSPLKIFFTNPVRGIALTFEKLGKREALKVGIVFCIIYAVISLIGVFSILPRFLQPRFIDLLKAFLLILALPLGEFLLLSLVCFAFILKEKSTENLFITGTSVLPL